MTRWEYRIIKLSSDKNEQTHVLNHFGSIGWELIVVVDAVWFYFKRPISS